MCESSVEETPNKSSNSQLTYSSFKTCKEEEDITVSRLLFALLGSPLPGTQSHVYRGNSTAAVPKCIQFLQVSTLAISMLLLQVIVHTCNWYPWATSTQPSSWEASLALHKLFGEDCKNNNLLRFSNNNLTTIPDTIN